MKTYRFGIIGCGLMGREFGSAVARWCHLTDVDFRPEITAVCDVSAPMLDWFKVNFPGIRLATNDYHELLASDAVDCVYCAVPHNLHASLYCDIIRAGKHLLGEKPFGIDLAATLREPEVTRRLKEMGYVPRFDSPSEFATFLRRERAHWTEVAQAYGAKPAQ